jgi:hypothetical protein
VVQFERRALTAEAAEVLAATGQQIGEPLPHCGFVRALGLSPDGTRLVSMGDGTDGLRPRPMNGYLRCLIAKHLGVTIPDYPALLCADHVVNSTW